MVQPECSSDTFPGLCSETSRLGDWSTGQLATCPCGACKHKGKKTARNLSVKVAVTPPKNKKRPLGSHHFPLSSTTTLTSTQFFRHTQSATEPRSKTQNILPSYWLVHRNSNDMVKMPNILDIIPELIITHPSCIFIYQLVIYMYIHIYIYISTYIPNIQNFMVKFAKNPHWIGVCFREHLNWKPSKFSFAFRWGVFGFQFFP